MPADSTTSGASSSGEGQGETGDVGTHGSDGTTSVEGSSSTTEEGSSDGSSTGADIPEPGDASGVRVKAFVSHVAVDPDTTEATVWFVAERPRGDISTHGGFSIRVTTEDGFRGSGLYTPLDQEVYFAPGERYASVRVALQAGRAEGLHQVVVRASNPNGGAVLHADAYAFSYLDIEDDGIPADARHVDPGADAGDGTPEDPWSLEQAFTLAEPGDLVLLHGGTYSGSMGTVSSNNESSVDGFAIEVDGTSEANRIVFMGAPGEQAVLDQQGQHGGIYLEGRSFITVRNLEIRNIENSQGTPSGGIYASTGPTTTHLNIEQVYSHSIVGGIGSNTASFKLQQVDGARLWRVRGDDVTLQGEANGNCAVVHSYGMRGTWVDASVLGPTGGTGSVAGSGVFHKRDDTPDEPDLVMSRTLVHSHPVPIRFSLQGAGQDMHDLAWLHNNVVVDGGYGGVTLGANSAGGPGTANIGRNNTYVNVGASELGTLNNHEDFEWDEQNSVFAHSNRVYSAERSVFSEVFAGSDFNVFFDISTELSSVDTNGPDQMGFDTLEAHSAATGIDAHSVMTDPGFANPSGPVETRDYRASAARAHAAAIDGNGVGAHAGPEGPGTVSIGTD